MIVDDDRNIRELINIYLQKDNYRVIEAGNGLEAFDYMEKEEVHLVVLDIMMPQMNGWQFCKELRQRSNIPILMVSAKGDSEQKIKGFLLGTDDYLSKPFDPQELVLRVRALLKRYKMAASQTVICGDLVMDRSRYEATLGKEKLVLPLKEYELLYKLVSYPDKIFTRDNLIEQLWGKDYEGDERTVDVHIKRLRERLSGKTNRFFITTIRGVGYRLEVNFD